MENMSTVLKPDEISFGVLFFSANTASVPDVFEIIAQLLYLVYIAKLTFSLQESIAYKRFLVKLDNSYFPELIDS